MPPIPMDGDIYIDNERFLVPCNIPWSSSISGKADFSIDEDGRMLYKSKIIYYNGVVVLSTDNTIELRKYTTRQTLAGTTWLLNSSIDLYESVYYHINFSSNSNQYTSFTVNDIGMEGEAGIYYDSTKVYGAWVDQAYRTIEITDGTDIANSDLVSWLAANAVQQVEPEPSSNKVTFGSLPIDKIIFGQLNVDEIYMGQTLIWHADSPTPPPVHPNKGDIITLDGGTARYRVLKMNGDVAEVLGMDTVGPSQFNEKDTTTTTFSNGSTGQKYNGSTLDRYINSTFYNSLSTNIKNAIVQKDIVQSMYQPSPSKIAGYDFAITKITPGTEWYKRKGQVGVGNRYCYALDLDDIAEYLGAGSGNTVSGADLYDMFYGQTTSIKNVWLDSASSDDSDYAFLLISEDGFVKNNYCRAGTFVRPAFQVDLSKVSWVKE